MGDVEQAKPAYDTGRCALIGGVAGKRIQLNIAVFCVAMLYQSKKVEFFN